MRFGLINKKFLVSVFIVLIIFLVLPKSVFAQAAVLVVNPSIVAADALVITFPGIFEATQGNWIQRLFEWAFKIAAEALKRQLLNEIVDQIVVWIQGGGDPKFITNWPGFLQDAVDQASGQFLTEIGLSNLCSAFRPHLSAAFIPIPKFSDRSACTFSQADANIDAFLNDFRTGGWAGWQEMVLRPENNIYGAYLMAWDEIEARQALAAKAAASEAQAGRGFLGVRRCLESVVDQDGVERCAKSEIITPGAAVGDLVSKAVGSDIDYIVNAQDFAAYVAAITNAILNRIFAEGVGLLRAGLSQ